MKAYHKEDMEPAATERMEEISHSEIRACPSLSIWGHRRICSKPYAKGSGMIPRLDGAVERRASEPGLAGRLDGRRRP